MRSCGLARPTPAHPRDRDSDRVRDQGGGAGGAGLWSVKMSGVSHRLRLVAALVTLALVGVACSDDGTGGATEPPETGATADAGSASTTELPAVDGPFAPGRTRLEGFGEVEVRIVDGPDGKPIVLCVLLAETPDQRARGLMGVEDPDLGGYDGMLFTFDDDSTGGFYMKDTLLPLSIAYLDAEGAVVDARDMEPCPSDAEECPTYPPSDPYRNTLEVPQGGLEPLGLVPGSPALLEVGGTCPPA